MSAPGSHWPASSAASILLSYTLRGALLSFLYLMLPAILRAGGTSLSMTTLSALVFLPLGLIWLWAPWMDRSVGPGRRGWVAGALLLACGAFTLLGRLDPLADYAAVLGVAVLVATAGATIGTATDAAILDGVAARHRGWANALQAAGVALGGLAIGAIGVVYGARGWEAATGLMAVVAAIGAGLVYAMPPGPATPVLAADRGPLGALLRGRAARQTLAIVVLSRAGLHLPMGILAAFQIDAGLSVATAALVGGTGGAVAGLVGAAIGGAVATRLSPRRAVVATLAAIAMGSAGLAVLVASVGTTPAVALVLAAYVFLLTTPVFVAMHRQFMQVARPGHHAADMSVLTGTEFLIGLLVAINAGWIAEIAGYPMLFVLSATSAVAGMVLAWRRLGDDADMTRGA